MTSSHLPDPSFDTALAIIGMTGRFPGALTIDQLWNNLAAGTKSIQFFSPEELVANGVDRDLVHQPNYVRAGTVLEGVELFDAPFFGYTPREAEIMDPQHRLFLECAWEALEDAAYNPETYRGRIGVFAGSGFSTYLLNNLQSNPQLLEMAGGLQVAVGNERDSLASTVSYKLNLKGPSLAVQTFCSTSLVAVHLACQSLLTYESDMVLAGGVAIEIPQGRGYLYQEGGIVSPDGEVRTFDAKAQGSVIGNGVGVVVLKRMEDALADGDHIYAVIRGSAVNNDGVAKVGYTAPGLSGQASVIAEALATAGVEAETINYMEAHGTATPLGDAVELAAMIKAFQNQTDRQQFCAIGSVKPNIGHLDRASGVTGLIKTALAFDRAQLPPSLNFVQANPELDLAHSPFYVNTALMPWPRTSTPRRAGVSSFGLGGTNAHVVLEEAPVRPTANPRRPQQLLVLSAKTATALTTATRNLAAHLVAHPEQPLADVAYTLQVGRSAFNHRRAVVVQDQADAIAALTTDGPERLWSAEQPRRDRPVVFLLPGVDDHYAGMAQALYQDEPVFRAAVDRCYQLFEPHLGLDLHLVLYPLARDSTINQLPYAEACLFVNEYALAQLLHHWGIQPQAIFGMGVGEYVAANLAGVLSLEDAVALVAERTLAIHNMPHTPSKVARSITPHVPTIPFISTMTGTWITAEQAADPAYWTRSVDLCEQVESGIATICAEAGRVLLELGSGQTVSKLSPDHLVTQGNTEQAVLAALPSAGAQVTDWSFSLAMLGKLWLAGVTIDWTGVYDNERRQRLRLPTYPFERQRYWIEPQAPNTANDRSHKTEGRKADPADWFYLPVWKQSLALLPPDLATLTQQVSWLVFDDGSSLGQQLRDQLLSYGCVVTSVRAGTHFIKHCDREYTINPAHADDYSRLLAALDRRPQMLIHLWSLMAEHDISTLNATFDKAQEYGFYSLINLVKAIGKQAITSNLEIWVISQTVFKVTGVEELRPEQAPLLGACRVIPQEYLNIVCRNLDIELPAPHSRAEQILVKHLLAELIAKSADVAIAYRGTDRWTQAYEPLHLAKATPSTSALRPQGVYLITGGLGEVGLVLAMYLAKTRQAKLVLTGRTELPDRTLWESWLVAHDPADPVSRKIQQLQMLEAQGADVLVARADVANLADMQGVLHQIESRFGRVHGVIHAAGTTTEDGFGSIQDISRAACELQFQPKVQGLFVLDQLFHDYELDFCILFSSLSAILGGLGFVGYTAANIFVDAFAHYHNQVALSRWLSVNWDTWQIRANPHGDLGATIADYGMNADEGADALERMLATGSAATQIINCTGDLHARFEQWIRLTPSATEQSPATLYPRPNLLNAYVAPTNATEERIAMVWQTILGVEQVGIHDNFLELGGNSLIGTQVISRLRQAFEVNIPLTILFEAPTVAGLALAIELILIEEIENLAEEEVLLG